MGGQLLRNRGMTFLEMFSCEKRGITLLGETIMGGTEYYQKISLLFSLFALSLFLHSGEPGVVSEKHLTDNYFHLVVEAAV